MSYGLPSLLFVKRLQENNDVCLHLTMVDSVKVGSQMQSRLRAFQIRRTINIYGCIHIYKKQGTRRKIKRVSTMSLT